MSPLPPNPPLPARPRRGRLLRWLAATCALLAVAAALAAAAGWYRYAHQPALAAGRQAQFDVARGAGSRQIAAVLREAGVAIDDGPLPALAWRLRGDAASVKAGRYRLDGPLTLAQVFDALVEGRRPPEAMFTLVAGWTLAQVREALARTPGLVADSAALDDAALAGRLGIDGGVVDGWLAPDTYAYVEGGSDLDVLQRARRLQQARLDAAWNARAPALALQSPQQLLTLASIVEKETGREQDRTRVSAVFNNRLRRGMMLQSDPTVIYGLGARFDGNLRRADLRRDTPYNSYTRKGLPPSPIAMPGPASIEAAAHPADGAWLYFVARGDGTSEFSDDLDAHNRAVDAHQRKGAR